MALKKYVKSLIKLVLTITAIYIVSNQINLLEAFVQISKAQSAWLLAAFILYNASKIVSALRLNAFFSMIHIYVNRLDNFKLYYIGMFYNLFLPGSIGGDGYKIFLLSKFYPLAVKDLIRVILLDRLSGVAALAFLAGILLYFSGLKTQMDDLNTLILIATISVFPMYYLVNYLLFKRFLTVFFYSNFLSIMVQFFQLICALCILLSLSLKGNFIDYLALFLISSIVSIIPITVGGVGARELVFLFGYQFLEINKTAAISFTLLFFIVSAISSLPGVFMDYKPKAVRI